MGYSPEMFVQLGSFIDKPCRILDVGSQDVNLFSEERLAKTNEFIAKYAAPLMVKTPAVIPAKDVFQAAGFDYMCTDVDSRPGTVHVDLQQLGFSRKLRASFDVVVNAGTTEHLANPIAGFLFVHYCTKPGGLMFHDVPLSGWANHGLMNPTPKFWHAMIWMNGYTTVHCEVTATNESQNDPGDFFQDYWGYMKGLMRTQSSLIRMVLRKGEDKVFIPPHDAAIGTREEERKLVSGSLRPYVESDVYSAREIEKDVFAFAYRDINVSPKARGKLVRFASQSLKELRWGRDS